MIQKIADLPQQQQILLAVLGAGLLFAAWYYGIDPTTAEVAAMKATNQQLTTEIETAQVTAGRLPLFQEEVQAQEQQLELKREKLPDEKETAEIVRQVQKLAEDSNLELKDFRPQSTVRYDFYEDWPILMSIEGSYRNLGLFFQKIAQFQRLINISDIQITSLDTTTDGNTIRATCTATTFVFLEETVPEAGTDSTD
ncbi:MAG: type 4a pilus biogenesis protein PilO [Acidobacteriota bacterium]